MHLRLQEKFAPVDYFYRDKDQQEIDLLIIKNNQFYPIEIKKTSSPSKNIIKHFHHNNPCSNEFETAISDKRKEIVYCKECYQAEFI